MKRSITYSPAYTLVPTYECFNRCAYCNFRQEPGASPWLSLETAAGVLRSLQLLPPARRISEILLLSGEVHPESPRRSAWFERIYDLCELAIAYGFLPHTNAGILSYAEMTKLKSVNASMGLMLEQLAPKLGDTVHRHAPSKDPALRWQQLEWAGTLQIPFTTGLLLGIGETQADWRETLSAIASLHQRWHHIQEVILQPYRPGFQQSESVESFPSRQLVKAVELARNILPDAIALQIPPNLVDSPQILLDCLSAGATDLGGICPKDEVNPDYVHPALASIAALLEPAGWELVPRLPVQPNYYAWLSPQLASVAEQYSNVKASQR
ncbi:7,8-didemethyl-8-hydroxy-5-deazariboflavin synthase subunit CofG [Oscillatoria sp. FACHB-1406]|uniref:7,8-didemethyl-8-hydroxy-5-deazariboflavin synthase subunit CofG n=1 Tax=Oscillatoria sp. FACHB-1406 TaxID=2692846 RepID=UPI0016839601|nr:7,8-didemethyl-8-hydroxy-5-deazariboflavin synthase subunit CofG [Oscillatoria sp. FACHB-1406]MBD2580598.1 7,8-didemethyl-8-hydroxy-5-deazariboflavin synthase subunit CofG [Oscillatoria sp. FACHB-1406]